MGGGGVVTIIPEINPIAVYPVGGIANYIYYCTRQYRVTHCICKRTAVKFNFFFGH